MIIGLTGRIGSGKETLTQFLRDKGFLYFETSKLIKSELEKRGLEISRKNMQDIGDELRKNQGPGVFMKMFLDKIDIKKNCIIDSLRNTGEVEFMRENVDNFILIGVDALREIRFKRIVERGKISDLANWDEFIKIDERDNFDPENPMGQQVGKCIEMADFVIENNNGLDQAMKKIEEIYNKIIKTN